MAGGVGGGGGGGGGGRALIDAELECMVLQVPHEPQFELVCQKCGVRKSSVKRLSYM